MQQYFIKGQVENPVIIKDKDTVKHMFNVMRLTEDDQVVLVFEDGIKRLARVTDRENHIFEVIEDLNDNVEMPVSVTIASGFPKGDKLDLVTQKATELGAQAIWAFPADWSVVKWDGKKLAKKEDKLAKIALGAAEQSKRNRVPEVRLFEKKGEFLSELDNFDKIFRRIRKCQNPCRDYTEPIDVQKYPMPILEKKLPSWAGYRKEEI